MAITELQTRIALKYDSYENWTKEQPTDSAVGKNLVLLAGELGICEIPSVNAASNVAPTVLFKVGNGTDPFWKLPWASAKAADVYSWAKASNVVVDGKTIKFVGGAIDTDGNKIDKVITLNFATPEEVESKVATERARIAALEAKFGEGDDTIDAQIESIVDRLDAIEDEASGAVATAKAYTDEREAEIEKAYKKYTDDADAARKTYIDGEVDTLEAADSALADRLDVIEGEAAGSIKKAVADAVEALEGYADQAEADAIEAAKDYTDEREVAIKAAYEKYTDDKDAARKTYVDNAVSTIDAKDAAQDKSIKDNADAIAAEKLAREQADQAINTKIGTVAEGKDVVTMIGDAQTASTTAANGYTDTQVQALANGAVAQNTADIAAIDKAYKEADVALDGRLDTVEAKLNNVTNVMDFRGAVAVLPESTEGYNNGDVIVVTGTGDAEADKDNTNIGKEFVVSDGKFVEFGYADGNTAAIEALQGRMDTAEDDIDQAQADIDALEEEIVKKLATETYNAHVNGDHAKTATEITTEIGTAVKAEEDARKAADKVITDAIGTSDDTKDKATVYGAIAAAADAAATADAKAAAAAGRLDVVEPKVTTLQDIVAGYSADSTIKAAVDAAQKAADDAQDAADKAQDEVDALELVVAGVTETAEDAQTRVAAVEPKLEQAEKDIDALEAIVSTGDDANSKLRTDITELQGIVKTGADANATLRSDLKALQDAVNNETTGLAATKDIADEAKSDAENAQSRVAAIEADYLKGGDLYIFNCGSSTVNVHKQA